MDPLSLSKEFIKIDSSNPPGKTLEFANYIKDILEPKNFDCTLIKKGKDSNLIAVYGKNPEMVFSGHLDTVVPDLEEWDSDPWKPYVKNGKLYGLGSCDMKGPLATILTSILKNKEKMKKGCRLMLTFDEETGFKGIKAIPRKFFKGKYCIVCEPSMLTPIFAHKGLLKFELYSYGKSCHGSRPDKGINAAKALIEFETLLCKMNKKIMNKKNKILGKPTYNLGLIKSGRVFNIVPSHGEMQFEYRLLPEFPASYVLKHVLGLLKKFSKTTKAKLKYSTPHIVPYFFNTKPSEFKNKIAEFSTKCPRSFTGTTESPCYHSKGIDTLVLGPGGKTPHKANEYISISQLKKGEKLYNRIIQTFC